MAVFTSVDEDAAQGLLDTLGLGRLHGLTGIPAGIENSNFFLDCDAGRFVLTLFERLTHAQLPFYLGLMQHLAAKGLPVPAPQADAAGRTLFTLEGKPAAVVTRLRGAHQLAPDRFHCEQLGHTLARLHLAVADFPLRQPNLRGLAWWQQTVPPLLTHLDAERAALLADELRFQTELAATPAFAKMQAKPVEWSVGQERFSGYVVYDDAAKAKRPGLVMVPNWMGVTDDAVARAKAIAGDDYVVLVADVWGKGKQPKDSAEAQRMWSAAKAASQARAAPLGGMPPMAQAFAGDPQGDAAARERFDDSRRNFLALVFCLMVGTAALPHILVRYYTTPTVREARTSVAWSLFFIALLYLSAPALAVLVKYELLSTLLDTPFDRLPAWIAAWSKVDPALLSVEDLNHDGVLQWGELRLGADIIVLATPEIAGLPYVVSAMVAAGGLAAALSTADGLLLTISNSLGHDLYYKMIDPQVSTSQRVTLTKALMLLVTLAAAAVTAQKPPDLLVLVAAAFSIAAATFFPALVLGIFWKRTTGIGASLGMVAGLGITFYYMVTTQPWLRGIFGVTSPIELWWGIQPISAGVFGVPIGFAVIILVSLVTPAPSKKIQELVEHVRYPNLRSA